MPWQWALAGITTTQLLWCISLGRTHRVCINIDVVIIIINIMIIIISLTILKATRKKKKKIENLGKIVRTSS